MTTAGRLVHEPLSKAHCRGCGLLQRVGMRHLARTDFYERQYSFYERPGAANYDRPRYAAMARWITDAIGGQEPVSVLDAGCGRGWMMAAMRKHLPGARFDGIEPSEQESENARRAGFPVITAKVDERLSLLGSYDLVYSTNVLEHTANPREFLQVLAGSLSDGGVLVIVCPDAAVPNAEFMFSDQNYSFTPEHLAALGRQAGLVPRRWQAAPAVDSIRDKQLMVFSRPSASGGEPDPPRVDPAALYSLRCRYVASYSECSDYLVRSSEGFARVLNFGTSTWSMLLAAYCPDYWARVAACVIDGGAGEFQGRPVVDFASLAEADERLLLVLGVNPYSQDAFARRLTASGRSCVKWNHLICR